MSEEERHAVLERVNDAAKPLYVQLDRLPSAEYDLRIRTAEALARCAGEVRAWDMWAHERYVWQQTHHKQGK